MDVAKTESLDSEYVLRMDSIRITCYRDKPYMVKLERRFLFFFWISEGSMINPYAHKLWELTKGKI